MKNNKRMNRIVISVGVFILGFLVSYLIFGYGGSSSQPSHAHQEASKQLYTCGMHPNVIQDEPGDCPICQMKLTPMKKMDSAEPVKEQKQLYTCGMHPNVIQEEPGDCPICNMKLTPMKQDVTVRQVKDDERKILYWRAPMDPNYISDKPGKSPMGMDLVPVFDNEVNADAISIDPAITQNIGVRTATVETGPISREIKAVGYVVSPENQIGIINLRFSGWIEDTYVNETGQEVEIGDPLFDIYSPELLSSQEEYLNAWKTYNKSGDKTVKSTLEAAELRLLNYNLTGDQLNGIINEGKAKQTVTIYSPFGGVVLMQKILPGQYVKPATDLYHIADLSSIWVEVSVFDENIPYIKKGTHAEMTIPPLPGEKWEGMVTFVSPIVDEKNRDLKVRLEFRNPGNRIKPGMFASINMHSTIAENGMLVPKEAVIHSGEREIVFIEVDKGRFAAREVQVGVKAMDDKYQILKGLIPGEKIVVSGQFLLDSESSLREATRKMLAASQAEPSESPANDSKTMDMKEKDSQDHSGHNH